jgi:hypothetical protein
VSERTTLYRVFGGEARGLGQSWITVNPGTVSDFRSAAGLFPGNSGQFVIEGMLTDTTGVTLRSALPEPGGLSGGIPEDLSNARDLRAAGPTRRTNALSQPHL